MSSPTIPRRAQRLSELGDRRFDLLVIGGGITGAGIARDAARRGLAVALVEREDFAAGTSSRSSRLIHGGLRYLEYGDTALVVVGGAGLPARAFAQGLIRLGLVEALGMDIDSSANLNWRGASLNRPSYQRQMPTGTIIFYRPPR